MGRRWGAAGASGWVNVPLLEISQMLVLRLPLCEKALPIDHFLTGVAPVNQVFHIHSSPHIKTIMPFPFPTKRGENHSANAQPAAITCISASGIDLEVTTLTSLLSLRDIFASPPPH